MNSWWPSGTLYLSFLLFFFFGFLFFLWKNTNFLLAVFISSMLKLVPDLSLG